MHQKNNNSISSAVLCLIFFSPALAYLAITIAGGNTLLFEDGLLQSFPFRVFLRNSFENGFSPQWVPFSACGFSLLAEGQNGICFPSTQIIYRLFSAETGWLVEIISARLTAFTLCVLFLRQANICRAGSLFGASVYAFCTATFGLESVPALIWCHALLPGIFLSVLRFMERRPFSFLYLTMFLSGVILTGHPVMVIYIGITLSLFFAFHWMGAETGTAGVRAVGSRLLLLLGSILVAAMIASPQLLPMLEEFRFSARTVGADISLDVLQNTLHLEPVWGALSLFPTPLQWGEWGGMSNTIRFPLYALFLGFIGMIYGTKGASRGYFVFLGLFSVLMALGPYVGLWKLVHSMPILEYFRFPYRWLFFLPICVAYLSARGIDHLLDRQNELPPAVFGRIPKYMLITVLASVGVILISYHSLLLQQTRKVMELLPLLTGLLWLSTFGMVLAAFLSLGKKAPRQGVIVGVTLTIISLFSATAFNIRSPMAIRTLDTIGWKGAMPSNAPQTYRTSSAMSPYEVVMKNTMSRHYPYTPNLTVLNGTLTTGHYFSFFPYWAANVSAWCRDALNGDHKKRIYLDVSSAKWLFLQENDSSSEMQALPAASFKGMNAHINPGAISRASVVFSNRLFSDEASLLTFMESPDFDPRREVAILSKDARAWDLHPGTIMPAATTIPPDATITVDRPDHIEIALKPAVSKGAYLVLSDTYYPGWRVMVDGVETEILRTNYAFRGIQLPAGAQHIVFSYDPLVPDALLPLPALLLTVTGMGICFRHYLNSRRS